MFLLFTYSFMWCLAGVMSTIRRIYILFQLDYLHQSLKCLNGNHKSIMNGVQQSQYHILVSIKTCFQYLGEKCLNKKHTSTQYVTTRSASILKLAMRVWGVPTYKCQTFSLSLPCCLHTAYTIHKSGTILLFH